MNEIRSIYEQQPFYGYRKVHAVLNRQIKLSISKGKTQRLMKAMGLKALYPGKRTSIPNKNHKKHPYLLKELKIDRVNKAYQIDITYIKLRNGYGYLVCLIDIYSRKIMGWSFSPFLDTHMCLEALNRGLQLAQPEIINSDQGSQFTSNMWCDALKDRGIEISMDGKGRWVDNIYVERLWRTIKWEAVYLHSFDTMDQATSLLEQYINFYNTERPHQSLDYKTPDEIYYASLQREEIRKLSPVNRVNKTNEPITDSEIHAVFLS